MEWAEYKTLCDRPDYQSKWLIKQTLELVRAMGVEEVIEELTTVLMTEPLPLPGTVSRTCGVKQFPSSTKYMGVLNSTIKSIDK